MSTETRQASASSLTPEDERNVLLGLLGRQYKDIYGLCCREVQPLAVLRHALSTMTDLSVVLQQSDGLIWELRERADEFGYDVACARAWVEVAIATHKDEDFERALVAIAAIREDPLEKFSLWLHMIRFSHRLNRSIRNCRQAIAECEDFGNSFEEGEEPYMDLNLAVLRREPGSLIFREGVNELVNGVPGHIEPMADGLEKYLAQIELLDLSEAGGYRNARGIVFCCTDQYTLDHLHLLCRVAAKTGSRDDYDQVVGCMAHMSIEDGDKGYIDHMLAEMIEEICQNRLCYGNGNMTPKDLSLLIKRKMTYPDRRLRGKIALAVCLRHMQHQEECDLLRKEIEQDLREYLQPENRVHEVTCVFTEDEVQRRYCQALAQMGYTKDALKAVKRISDNAPLEQLKALAAIAQAKRLAKAS